MARTSAALKPTGIAGFLQDARIVVGDEPNDLISLV
jgi:hypothetical protein